ncbi:unnamed protein product [Candidula unifasciata]|uniref:XPG-I domain-containing protein n=1 Tax=Candidula unifasciata TaxID=100452 RepID=A0A8S3YDJ4_9EUPU|nr:unnamed protein product [Candidula unifasciata]
MGVGGLWSLLSPVGKEMSLEFCKGKKLAVDLSAWIVQCSVVATSKPIPASYLCCRGIFMRTLNLLSLGVSLVFVIDGPNPPAVKRRTKSRDDFYRTALEYKVLLTALGLPVIECDGEAEKLCAELNLRKLVDGVITNDGDALIYGAETVYKGLLQDKKVDHIAMVYHMEDVRTSLNLSRRDLVAFALLSAGDFSLGVPNIREKKFIELMKEFKINNIEDALHRFMTWSANTELDCLDQKMKSLADMKTRHCTKCLHEGTKQEHVHSGCQVCQVDSECRQGDSPDHPPCLCEYHLAEESVKTYKMELKIRELALKSDPGFPDRAVIQEYLQPLPQMLDDVDLCVRVPDFPAVCSFIQERLHYSFQHTMSYLVPATIKMAIHGVLPDLAVTPRCIIKTCKVNFEQCFLVRWKKLDEDELSDESSYAFHLSQTLFASKYPDMVEDFMGATRCKNQAEEGSRRTFLQTVHDDIKDNKG